MYYIQYVSGSIYIYYRENNDLNFDWIKNSSIAILKNQFIDRSLVIIHDLDLKTKELNNLYTTKSGEVIFNSFYILGDSLDDKKYILLSAHQVKNLMRELL